MHLFTCGFSHKGISVLAECTLLGRVAQVFGQPATGHYASSNAARKASYVMKQKHASKKVAST